MERPELPHPFRDPRPLGRITTHECADQGGGGWIRTSVGAWPTDLQSAPFSHSGTPPREAGHYSREAQSCQTAVEPLALTADLLAVPIDPRPGKVPSVFTRLDRRAGQGGSLTAGCAAPFCPALGAQGAHLFTRQAAIMIGIGPLKQFQLFFLRCLEFCPSDLAIAIGIETVHPVATPHFGAPPRCVMRVAPGLTRVTWIAMHVRVGGHPVRVHGGRPRGNSRRRHPRWSASGGLPTRRGERRQRGLGKHGQGHWRDAAILTLGSSPGGPRSKGGEPTRHWGCHRCRHRNRRDDQRGDQPVARGASPSKALGRGPPALGRELFG